MSLYILVVRLCSGRLCLTPRLTVTMPCMKSEKAVRSLTWYQVWTLCQKGRSNHYISHSTSVPLMYEAVGTSIFFLVKEFVNLVRKI